MTRQLKCGCIFDGKSFVKHCRDHAKMVLLKRIERNGPFYAPKKLNSLVREGQGETK